jgi:hypothetical protein
MSEMNETREQLQARIAVLEAQVRETPRSGFSIRVNPKGVFGKPYLKDGVSVTPVGKGNIIIAGLARFPMAFYPTQLLAILNRADELRTTIETNRDQLSWKKGD